MTDQSYLWDKSEPSDPFVVKLERLLAARRQKVKQAGRRRRLHILRVVSSIAIVAAAAAAVLVSTYFGTGEGKAVSPDVVAPPVAIGTDDAPEEGGEETESPTLPENEVAEPALDAVSQTTAETSR